MLKLIEIRKSAADRLTRRITVLLAKTPVSPDFLTWTGLWLTVVAGILVIYENLLTAGIVVLFAGFFDMLDGALARLTERTTKFGAVLDSTLDRLSEAILLLSIMIFFGRQGSLTGMTLAGIAMIGSFLVSYVRARTEGIGIECKAGFFTRPERVIVLSLGLLLGKLDYALITALVVIIFFSFFTATQRLFRTWQQTKNIR
ncbi:CDP-alcohol phosphatidyltransferase family protein [Chloroflexota bacterium]